MVFNINWNKQQKYWFDVLQPTKHVICLTHNSAAQSIQSVDRKWIIQPKTIWCAQRYVDGNWSISAGVNQWRKPSTQPLQVVWCSWWFRDDFPINFQVMSLPHPNFSSLTIMISNVKIFCEKHLIIAENQDVTNGFYLKISRTHGQSWVCFSPSSLGIASNFQVSSQSKHGAYVRIVPGRAQRSRHRVLSQHSPWPCCMPRRRQHKTWGYDAQCCSKFKNEHINSEGRWVYCS
jgi:hypothetical protein